MADYVRAVLYGTPLRMILTARVAAYWSRHRAFLTQLGGGHGLARRPVASMQPAQLISHCEKIKRDAFGSALPLVFRRLGDLSPVLNLNSQYDVELLVAQRWQERVPADADRVCTYFARLIAAFWRVLAGLPGSPWAEGTQALWSTALTVLYCLRDGLCLSVVYNQESGQVIHCLRSMNDLDGQCTACGVLLRTPVGSMDVPLVQSQLWTRSRARLDHDVLDAQLHQAYVTELCLVPAHPLLLGMPSDDMAPLLNIDSPFHHTEAFNHRGQLQRALAHLLDKRNPRWQQLTVDDLRSLGLQAQHEICQSIGLATQ